MPENVVEHNNDVACVEHTERKRRSAPTSDSDAIDHPTLDQAKAADVMRMASSGEKRLTGTMPGIDPPEAPLPFMAPRFDRPPRGGKLLQTEQTPVSPDPPWTPTPKPFKNRPPPLLPPGLDDVKIPFVRPPRPDLGLRAPTRTWPSVDNPWDPPHFWSWQDTVRRRLPSLRFRRLRYWNQPLWEEGCNGPGSPQRENMQILWGQTLGMVEIASIVLRRYLEGRTDQDRRKFWGAPGQSFVVGEPEFVDPNPWVWLGTYNTHKAGRLLAIVDTVRRRMLFGHDYVKQYMIWCRNRTWEQSGGSTSYGRIRFDWSVLATSPNDEFQMNRVAIWEDTRHPCWSHRVLMHEILHWIGFDLYDIPVTFQHPEIPDTDRGPSPVYPIGEKYMGLCYGGVCAKQIARSPTTAKNPEKNVDNYAYLIRNLALHWTSEVMSPAPTPGILPDYMPFRTIAQCTSDCNPDVFWIWP